MRKQFWFAVQKEKQKENNMYLNSNREKILKYILLITGLFSVTSSLYLSFGIYFSALDCSFITRTFKIYHLILVAGYFGLTLFTDFNKSFFKRRFYGCRSDSASVLAAWIGRFQTSDFCIFCSSVYFY